jgi:secreted trypsin-like serine protease
MIRLVIAGFGACLLATDAQAQTQQIEVGPSVDGAYESVCHLRTARTRVAWAGSTANGSGVLYQGRYVITAAHNVYSPWYNRLTSLRVTCGVGDVADAPHLQVDPGRVRVSAGYFWRRFNRDFAVIELPAPINVSMPFRLGGIPAIGSSVRIAGFPGSADDADRMNGERLFSGVGPRTDSAPLMSYAIATFTGNSGGPVWIDTANGPALAGVHVSGSDGGSARAVDDEFLREVTAMIADLEASRRP